MWTCAWLWHQDLWVWLHPLVAWVTDKLLGPALVAVVFSSITNIALEHRKARRDLDTKICDELRDDLRMLQQLSLGYWERKRQSGDAALEARMTSLQTEIVESLVLLAEEAKLAVASDSELAELMELTTGGGFGSVGRAADPLRARKISSKLGEMRTRVAKLRWGRLRKFGN